MSQTRKPPQETAGITQKETYALQHAKPERQNNKKKQKKVQREGFWTDHAEKGDYNQDQKDGKFSFDTIHGMRLTEVDYTVAPYEERCKKRAQFEGVYNEDHSEMKQPGLRAKFLKHLAENHRDELKEKLGFTDEVIDKMVKDGYAPNGYNVHHKMAIHGGGKNEFSNFILTPNFPHDQWHKDIMDPQLLGIKKGETRKVLIPWTDDMIYDAKKFGITKDNQKVEPNYKSVVDVNNYPANYLPEHVTRIKYQADKEKDGVTGSLLPVPLHALQQKLSKKR